MEIIPNDFEVLIDFSGFWVPTSTTPIAPGIFQASPSTVPAAFYDRYDARGLPIELNRLVRIPAPVPIPAAVIPRIPGAGPTCCPTARASARATPRR